MGVGLSQRLVPDELWSLVASLLPSFASCSQGGGTAPVDERTVFTAVVYVLISGCALKFPLWAGQFDAGMTGPG